MKWFFIIYGHQGEAGGCTITVPVERWLGRAVMEGSSHNEHNLEQHI